MLEFNVDKYKVNSGIGRMLYYAPIKTNKDNKNPNWCGIHRDHGLFTALAPGVFFKNNKQVSKPKDAGLYVRGKPINIPNDVLLFQIGETFELLTNG